MSLSLKRDFINKHDSQKVNLCRSALGKSYEFDESIPLSDLNLPEHYQKLQRRLENSVEASATVSGILTLTLDEFASFRGVGPKTVESLARLKSEIFHYFETYRKMYAQEERKNRGILESARGKTLNLAFLDEDERKLIDKLKKVYPNRVNAYFILTINPERFGRKRGVGDKCVYLLEKMQDRICMELKIHPETEEGSVPARGLFVSTRVKHYDPLEVEQAMIDDLNYLLSQVDPSLRTIAMGRWGYKTHHQSLEELGQTFGVTRERIRMREKSFNQMLIGYLRIHPKVLKANIRRYLNQHLFTKMHRLPQRFAKPELYLEFLETCCDVPKGSIWDVDWLRQNKMNESVLEDFFANVASPVAMNDVIEELKQQYDLTALQSKACIEHLKRMGYLRQDNKGVYPQNMMDKKAAVAHVLASHPDGLPWKEVAQIVNENQYSSSPVSQRRLDHNFLECPNIFLCGWGTYRHLKYLDLSKYNVMSVLDRVKMFIEAEGQESCNLQIMHNRLSDELDMDYYTLRHIVGQFGKKAGLYLKGQSHVDTISLVPEGKKVRLKEAILRVLEQEPQAMTIDEITGMLRTRNTRLVYQHLASLQENARVVRVDRLLYTSYDKAMLYVKTG